LIKEDERRILLVNPPLVELTPEATSQRMVGDQLVCYFHSVSNSFRILCKFMMSLNNRETQFKPIDSDYEKFAGSIKAHEALAQLLGDSKGA
jgi:hypothetical protein